MCGQIQILQSHNEKMQKKLENTEKMLKNLGQNDGTWVGSMLSFCESETKEFKDQLYGCMLKKAELEETLMLTQKDLAKWRFEALKSRCVILDREGILEDHKIAFKSIYFCADNQIEEANPTPRIITKTSPAKSTLPVGLLNNRLQPKVESLRSPPSSIKQQPTEETDHFDIYEDTTVACLPVVKRTAQVEFFEDKENVDNKPPPKNEFEFKRPPPLPVKTLTPPPKVVEVVTPPKYREISFHLASKSSERMTTNVVGDDGGGGGDDDNKVEIKKSNFVVKKIFIKSKTHHK